MMSLPLSQTFSKVGAETGVVEVMLGNKLPLSQIAFTLHCQQHKRAIMDTA
jgi:hypothetical protein